MAWVKLDSGRATHRKLRKAGYTARGLDEAAMCQVCEDGTDGFLSDDALAMLHAAHGERKGRQLVDVLCEVGRWERDATRGGYIIHDYLDYNPTKAEWDTLVEKKAAAGRKGGKARARAHASASDVAGASTGALADAQAVPSRTVPSLSDSDADASSSGDDDDPIFTEALRQFAESKMAATLRRGDKIDSRPAYRARVMATDRAEFAGLRQQEPDADVARLLALFEQGVDVLQSLDERRATLADKERRRKTAELADLEARNASGAYDQEIAELRQELGVAS